jgi:transcriptional regulator with XRE-family HTH domain
MSEHLPCLGVAFFVEQADLAAATGYSTTATVSLIERGKKGIPLRRLEAAARLLGVAPEVMTGAPAFYDRLILSDPFTVVPQPSHRTIFSVSTPA